MSKKEKITYSVICPFCKEHKFSVVLEVDQKKEGEGGSFEARCPFCDKYVQVPIEQNLKLNTTVLRLNSDKTVLKGLAFDNESTS